MKIRFLVIALVVAMVAAACGDDSDTATTGEDGSPASDSSGDGNGDTGGGGDDGGSVGGGDGGDDGSGEAPPDDGEGSTAEDQAADLVEGLEDLQDAQGGGGARLVVGDMEWTFDSVLCAFGEEQIGQAGAVFNLSSIQDGLQMYASVDSFGDSVSLDDITDFQNPSVSLSAFGNATITIDGKNITAEGEFMDGTSDSFDTIPGTFTATCP